MNIIDQIDAATGCQHCQRPLGGSVSDDFCSAVCQTAWYAERSEPLVEYREPTDLAAHVSNLVEIQSPETLPFGRNARMADDVEAYAWNGDALPGEWLPIGWVDDDEPVTLGFDGSGGEVTAVRVWNRDTHFVRHLPTPEPISFNHEAIARVLRDLQTDLQNAMAAMQPVMQGLMRPLMQQLGHIATRHQQAEVRSPDRMQASLEARRNRNTGPTRAQRAPRRIDPRRGR